MESEQNVRTAVGRQLHALDGRMEAERRYRLHWKTPVDSGQGDLTTLNGAKLWVEWWKSRYPRDGWIAWFEYESEAVASSPIGRTELPLAEGER